MRRNDFSRGIALVSMKREILIIHPSKDGHPHHANEQSKELDKLHCLAEEAPLLTVAFSLIAKIPIVKISKRDEELRPCKMYGDTTEDRNAKGHPGDPDKDDEVNSC